MDWWEPLLSTLRLITVTIVGSLAIGIPAAWAASTLSHCGRSGRGFARAFILAAIAAIAIPMILHAAAWEATAGKFGWLPLTQTATRSWGGFAGLVACGWIHSIFGAAIVAMATWHGTSRVPVSILENASIDTTPLRCWWTIQLPLAWPWVLAATILNASLAATEMTVVDLYGYRTIADQFYLLYAVDPDLTSIATTTALPLAFAVAMITVLLRRVRARQTDYRGEHSVGHTASDLHTAPDLFEQPSLGVRIVAGLILTLCTLIMIAMPVTGLMAKVGHDVIVDGDQRIAYWSISRSVQELAAAPTTFSSEYQWTAMLGICTGIFAIFVAWPLAAVGRQHPRFESMVDALTIILFCIPGPLIGMSIVQTFTLPIPGFRFLYEMTILPTVLAMSVRASTIAYWILRSGYHGIADSVWLSARLELSLLRRCWQIDRRLMARSVVIALLTAGIIASGDVPVTLPVAPPGVSTVGTRLFGLLHSGARYQEAALALWYLGFIGLGIALIYTLSRFGSGKIK
ncbi:amino-acid ABC transporter permease protein Y4TF [Rhodopirellula maiorica SM1]|uniref:Amino-acid ABC transporter permease protein Y4TF n=1 Tax=Rhodopirellula maiorica SM1 TaxID=1265738 RepID=M5RMZ0_9BACT|nr:amino-acid ABC transporter permease protein Y4TF [Rhodopirellula maiorica SM1]